MITLDPPSTRPSTHASKQLLSLRLPSLRGFLPRARKATGVPGQVSVLLTTNRTLRRLNHEFRGKDQPTDVLSFPSHPISATQTPAKQYSGDLAISLDIAARQARSLRHSLDVEIRILILHGLLHLAGYDHEVDDGQMAVREEALRRRFRLPTALIARTSVPVAQAKKQVAQSHKKSAPIKGQSPDKKISTSKLKQNSPAPHSRGRA